MHLDDEVKLLSFESIKVDQEKNAEGVPIWVKADE